MLNKILFSHLAFEANVCLVLFHHVLHNVCAPPKNSQFNAMSTVLRMTSKYEDWWKEKGKRHM